MVNSSVYVFWWLTHLSACQDMATALKGALSGPVEALMLGLLKSPTQYDASELKASMKVRGHFIYLFIFCLCLYIIVRMYNSNVLFVFSLYIMCCVVLLTS